MSTQLIFTDPKLDKLVDKIKQLLRNRKSNEVQFSWCDIINVGTHVGTKSVKTNILGSCIFAETCTLRIITRAIIHSNSTGHLEEQIYF